jgi:hypothetical protein
MSRKGDVHVPFGTSDGVIPVKSHAAAVMCVPQIVAIPITAAEAGNFSFTAPYKLRVLDCWALHEGGAGEASDTVQLKNGATAITDAIDWSGADKVLVRAGEIDDAQRDVADGGTLVVTTVDADTGDDVGLGTVYVLVAKVP